MKSVIEHGPVPAERCDEVLAEAALHVKAVGMKVTSCEGWRVKPGSVADALLNDIGLAVSEAQVVRYGPGGEYAWHTDGPNRRITMIVQLSDPSWYEGGDVEIEEFEALLPRGRGGVTTFPAQVRHRTQPITKGERYVLVGWVR